MDIELDTNQKKNQKHRVKVAIRVRPFVQREIAINQSTCVVCYNNNQIIMANERAYNFDRVFNQSSKQSQIFQDCVKDLVSSCFDGYNAAILAYGQTGSGKTYTMGTSFNKYADPEQLGILPRVINHIFNQLSQRKNRSQFVIRASFLQIYNQQIIDLLSNDLDLKNNDKIKQMSIVTIRQQKDGSVGIYGARQPKILKSEEMLDLLQKGSLNRSTASTLMNGNSSRSHAIFTITIQQHLKENSEDKIFNQEESYITAKFFFVDLAGSQRAKKTGTTGVTFKQGININLGLLQLGNVISALSTIEKKQDQFITYRNSKLTRILQDCLGGNSNTYMIACISPAQSNYDESLNTLKYASKAMNIKNKPVINRDPQSALVSQLKEKILELQNNNQKLKSIISQNGFNVSQQLFKHSINFQDDYELKKLKQMYLILQKKYHQVQKNLKQEKKKSNETIIQNYQLRRQRDLLNIQFQEIKKKNPTTFANLLESQKIISKKTVLQQYTNKIQILQGMLEDKQKLYNELQAQYQTLLKDYERDQKIMVKKMKEIYHLTKQNKDFSKQLTKSKKKLEKLDQIICKSNVSPEKLVLQQKSQIINLPSYVPNQEPQRVFNQNLNPYLQHIIQEQQDDCNSQDQLQSDLTFRQLSENYDRISQERQTQMKSVSKFIQERQSYLNQITSEQIQLEKKLINQMKQEYHQKIIMLEKQKQNIINKKNTQTSVFEKNKLIQRNNSLENQIKDLKRKMQQQKSLEFTVSSQNNKINELRNQIKNFKLQKIEITRKIKEEKTKFEKYRKERAKQLLRTKKQNLKNQLKVKKLALQNSKKDQKIVKKQQQLKRIKRVNQALKSFSQNNKGYNNYKKIKSIANSRTKSIKMQNELQNASINQKEYFKIVQNSMKKILLDIDRSIETKKYEQKINQIRNQLDQLLSQQSKQRLNLERININNEIESLDKNTEKSQIILKINDLEQRISSCEQNYDFCKQKCKTLYDSIKQKYDVEVDIVYNCVYNSIQSLRNILKCLYKSVKSILEQNYQIRDQIQKHILQNSTLQRLIQQLNDQIKMMNINHKDDLTKIRQQMMTKFYQSMQQQQALNQQNQFVLKQNVRLDQKQRKNYQKKIQDLTKVNKQIVADLQTWRRKTEVIQDKYQRMRSMLGKDKFIGVDRQGKQQDQINHKEKKGINTSSNKNFIDQTFQNYNHQSLTGNTSNYQGKNKKYLFQDSSDFDDKFQMENGKQLIQQDDKFNKTKWNQITKIEAHQTPISSLANYSNLLISAATKSIKLWDLQTNKLISQFNGTHLNSFIKSVIFLPERSIFATACDKNVTFWDINSMSAVGTLKAHKQDVKAMHAADNYLFTGGKGLGNSGSLMIWDLRSMVPNNPIEQKQRGQDIFSMTSKQSILYYGTRNHQVRRIDFSQMQTLSPFEPPHMDTVTGLTIVKDYLVSGSKDKNLRLWSLNQSINHIKFTMHAFNQYITTLSTDLNLPIFYAGARDGQIKIGAINKDKIHLIGGINSHTQSVNTICPIQNNRQSIIATGSSDKTIRIWQPSNQTINFIRKQYD